MDKYHIQSNVFLQLKDQNTPDAVTTVIPIEIYFDFLAAFRKGMSSMHGPSQEVAVQLNEMQDLKIEIKPC